MKVCIPTENDKGMESIAFSHFGSAPYFILHDTETNETETIQNRDQHHAHGACHPMQALNGRSVNTVVVGGIGRRAVMGLNEMGITVYRSTDGTVQKNIDGLVNGTLEELTVDNACTQHGGCAG
jgi:predicted Fe-Mo cluster-binding NifX family protein